VRDVGGTGKSEGKRAVCEGADSGGEGELMGDVLVDPRFCAQHVYDDDYYGWKCRYCGLFFPFGCAPWEDGAAEISDDWDDEGAE